jgi:hypothetical protein
MTRRSLWLGLMTLGAALAPGPQEAPPPPPAPQDPASLADVRAQAGAKAFDLTWLYYSEKRVDSEKVYRWSRRLLEAQRDASVDKPGHVSACEAHLERIKKLEAKIQRIRRIGFGDSLDVLEVDYYRKEADFWLAQARASRSGNDRVDRP